MASTKRGLFEDAAQPESYHKQGWGVCHQVSLKPSLVPRSSSDGYSSTDLGDETDATEPQTQTQYDEAPALEAPALVGKKHLGKLTFDQLQLELQKLQKTIDAWAPQYAKDLALRLGNTLDAIATNENDPPFNALGTELENIVGNTPDSSLWYVSYTKAIAEQAVKICEKNGLITEDRVGK